MTVILIYLNNHIRNDAFSFYEVIERKKTIDRCSANTTDTCTLRLYDIDDYSRRKTSKNSNLKYDL
jgi:hypothetical protein